MPRSVYYMTNTLIESIRQLQQLRPDLVPPDYDEGTAIDYATGWMNDLDNTNNPPKNQRALGLDSYDDARITSIHATTIDSSIDRTLWRTNAWLDRAVAGDVQS